MDKTIQHYQLLNKTSIASPESKTKGYQVWLTQPRAKILYLYSEDTWERESNELKLKLRDPRIVEFTVKNYIITRANNQFNVLLLQNNITGVPLAYMYNLDIRKCIIQTYIFRMSRCIWKCINQIVLNNGEVHLTFI